MKKYAFFRKQYTKLWKIFLCWVIENFPGFENPDSRLKTIEINIKVGI